MRNLFNGRCLVCLLATLISCTAGADGHQVAAVETAKALSLTPDMENGRKLYGICAVCHNPEGWGSENGYYPQIAGQLSGVIIKQLADCRRCCLSEVQKSRCDLLRVADKSRDDVHIEVRNSPFPQQLPRDGSHCGVICA